MAHHFRDVRFVLEAKTLLRNFQAFESFGERPGNTTVKPIFITIL
jgi:hypothetical protein